MPFNETKKYRVVCYMRVDVEVDEDTLYDSAEAAQGDVDSQSLMQPENIFMIEEVNDVERT